MICIKLQAFLSLFVFIVQLYLLSAISLKDFEILKVFTLLKHGLILGFDLSQTAGAFHALEVDLDHQNEVHEGAENQD